MESGGWALVDLSDPRLGHPWRLLRELNNLGPKTIYPWPNRGDRFGCEKAAICLLLGFSPYPNRPPFVELVYQQIEKVNKLKKLLFNKYYRKIRDLLRRFHMKITSAQTR